MEERTLRVSIPRLPPWFVPVTENNVTRMDGIEHFEIPYLRKWMNINFELLDGMEPGYGNELSPGNWTGSVGMIMNGQADIMIGLFVASSKMFELVGLTHCFYDSTQRILSGPPNKMNQVMDSFLSSVTKEIWITLAVSWFVMSTLGYLMARAEAHMKGEESHANTYSNMLLAHYGLLFERGFVFLPQANSRRILLAGWLILSEILMTVIGGTFSSKLFLKKVPERVDRLEDLLPYKDLCPYLTKGIFVDDFLRHSSNPDYQELWRRTEACNGNIGIHEFFTPKIISKLVEGKGVFIGNSEFVLGSISSAVCQNQPTPMYLAKESFLSLPMMYLYSKTLEKDIAERYSNSMLWFTEMGLLGIETVVYQRPAERCLSQDQVQSTQASLSLQDLSSVFELLTWGLAAACTVSVLEIFLGRFVHRFQASDHNNS